VWRFMNFLNNTVYTGTKIILFICNSLALLTINISPLPLSVIFKLLMSFVVIFIITKKDLQICRSIPVCVSSVTRVFCSLGQKIFLLPPSTKTTV